jgi:hypothetical protein
MLRRRYAVIGASVRDNQVIDRLLDGENSGRFVWADSAYRSEARKEWLRDQGCKSRTRREGTSRRALNRKKPATDHRRSKNWVRLEHVLDDHRPPPPGG